MVADSSFRDHTNLWSSAKCCRQSLCGGRQISTVSNLSFWRIFADGVLLRGMSQLPRARDALLRLQRAGVPYLFVTNGGGEVEHVKAEKLAEALELPVDPRQVILSHTPLRPVIEAHAHQKILVLGCRDVVSVAKEYGAKRVYTAVDVAHDEPNRYPFIHYDRRECADRDEPFGAVFVLHDPNNWGCEIQIALDVIRGGLPLGTGNGHGAHPQSVPVYASNADLVFPNQYAAPRLAAGAFLRCLKLVFQDVTGSPLEITMCGKPTRMTFDFAARQLATWRDVLAATQAHSRHWGTPQPASFAHSPPPFSSLFHIGDNPAADIRGTLNAGGPWQGILVRTGVFRGGDNDPDHPAHVVTQGVGEAVDHILATLQPSRS